MSAVGHEIVTEPLLREWVRRPGGAEVRIAGQSMVPTLSEGRTVRVGRAESARAGDVVLIACPNGLVVHRLLFVSRHCPWLVHCGDNENARPTLARADALVGRVFSPRKRILPGAQLKAACRAVLDARRNRGRR